MKLGHLLMTTSLCAAFAGTAMAQGRPFSALDTDGNGMLSLGELTAAFGDRGATRILARGDADGDGMLSMDEVRLRNDDSSDDDESDDDESDDDESDDDSSDESDDDESDDDSSDESDDDSGDDSSDDDED